MSSVQLRDFAKERGQPEAAMLLGLTQGALSKAIRVGRNVVVTCESDGTFSAEERRPFPARSDSKSRSAVRPTLSANLLPASATVESDEHAGVLSSTQQASP